ncbi:SapB/AmfS family lanthipeptide [Actinospica robiniae]|nr:SapB/AmfS family lanthipeptide [Actinospica robiniae]
MSLLDLQALEAQSATKGGHGGGHGGGGEGGSEVSLLLCDSTASVLLCL